MKRRQLRQAAHKREERAMVAARGPSRETAEARLVRPSRRAARLGIALLALSAIFFGVNFTQEWLISHQIQQRAAQLQAGIAAANAQNAQLQNQLAYLSSKEYIIPAARALGMSQPGDTLMLVKQESPTVRIVRVHVRASIGPQTLFIRLLRAIFH